MSYIHLIYFIILTASVTALNTLAENGVSLKVNLQFFFNCNQHIPDILLHYYGDGCNMYTDWSKLKFPLTLRKR